MCNSPQYLEEEKSAQSANDIISGLIHQLSSSSNHNTILQVIANEALQPAYIIQKLQHEFIFCWIESDAILNEINFQFQFKLFFQHESILYIHKFRTSFKNIKSLHKQAYNDRKHFPVQMFPTGLFQHHLSWIIHIIICTLCMLSAGCYKSSEGS